MLTTNYFKSAVHVLASETVLASEIVLASRIVVKSLFSIVPSS